jgi:ERCC4-type nuclease
MKKVENTKLRDHIREMMQKEMELKEFDLIMPKKKEWKQEAKDLRMDLVTLLKNIENDEYEEGLEKINDVTKKLQDWKNKIQKFL